MNRSTSATPKQYYKTGIQVGSTVVNVSSRPTHTVKVSYTCQVQVPQIQVEQPQQQNVETRAQLALKRSCKWYVRQACDNNIEMLTIDGIRTIITKISHDSAGRGVPIQTIQATVLGIIVKQIPHMETGLVERIEYFAPLIVEIMPSSNHSESFSKQKIHEEKGVTGFQLLNEICWPGVSQVPSPNQYVNAVEKLINICGCDVLARNARGETALSSYRVACSEGRAPLIPEMERVLSAQIRQEYLEKMIRMIVNKFTPQSVSKFSNMFKLAFVSNISMLASKLIDYMLGFYTYSKKDGMFIPVKTCFETCHAMFKHPVIDDEWKTIIEQKYTSVYGSSDMAYYTLIDEIAKMAIGQIDVRCEFLMSKGADECACVAVDAIGAIVGEVSSMVNAQNYFTDFLNETLDSIKNGSTDEITLNFVMTSICHLIDGLHRRKANKTDMSHYLTPSMMNDISTLVKQKKIPIRIVIHIENAIKKFMGSSFSFGKYVAPSPSVPIKKQQPLTTIDEFIDVETFGSDVPTFLSEIDVPDNRPWDAWNDLIDDWIYSIQQKMKKNKNTHNYTKEIVSIIFCTSDEYLTYGTCNVSKLNLFKFMMDEAFGESRVRKSIDCFMKVQKKISPDFPSLFSSKNAYQIFMNVCNLYGVTH